MKCPFCDADGTEVYSCNPKYNSTHKDYKRYRRCPSCKKCFITHEYYIQEPRRFAWENRLDKK